MSFIDSEFQRIEAYTEQLKQIPLEEFETSAEARATFIGILKQAKDDIPWIVERVLDCQDSMEECSALDEAFIIKGILVLDRFEACYSAIQEIVLHEGHEELDELDIRDAFADAVCVEDALAKDLTYYP